MPKAERDKAVARGRQDAADRATCSTASRASSPAASASASPWAGRWCASRRCSCSTSRCPTSTPSCASTCAPRSSGCTRRLSTTIVYVTHDQIEAMTLATRIAVMKDGELQQVGTPAEIYNRPANIFVADFMGSPAMNLIPAEIERQGNDSATLGRPARRASRCRSRLGAARRPALKPARSSSASGPEAITDPDGADRNVAAMSSRRPASSRWWSPPAPTPSR